MNQLIIQTATMPDGSTYVALCGAKGWLIFELDKAGDYKAAERPAPMWGKDDVKLEQMTIA